jgi:voltage-gated potassium channel
MLSDSRKSFIRSHFLDLIVVALPFLRVLRIGLLVLMLVKMLGQLKNRILISVPVYALVTSILFVTLGAASVYDAEYQAEGSNIRSIEDSFWWAAVTIFTVGYGDRFPVTTEGRIYGVALMACGIAIVGTITATLAGWLISQIKEVESENKKLLDSLNRIEEKLQKF